MYTNKTPTNKSSPQQRLAANNQRMSNASPISKVETQESLIFSPKKDYRASNTTPLSRIDFSESELLYSPKKDPKFDYSTIQRIDTQESETSHNYSLYRTLGNITPTNINHNTKQVNTGNTQSPAKNTNLYNKNISAPKKEKVPERSLDLEVLNDSRGSPLVGARTPNKYSIQRASPVLDKSKMKINEPQSLHLYDKIESPSKGSIETLQDVSQQKEKKVFQYRSLTGSLFNKNKGA